MLVLEEAETWLSSIEGTACILLSATCATNIAVAASTPYREELLMRIQLRKVRYTNH